MVTNFLERQGSWELRSSWPSETENEVPLEDAEVSIQRIPLKMVDFWSPQTEIFDAQVVLPKVPCFARNSAARSGVRHTALSQSAGVLVDLGSRRMFSLVNLLNWLVFLRTWPLRHEV